MIFAAQYVRMSTDQQPMSTDIQRTAIAAYAQRQGYEVVRTYSDEAKSGLSLTGRAGMTALLRDVTEASCPFKVVLVLDVSRWGRYQDVDEAAYYEYHCRKHGVRVEYVAEIFGQSATPNPYDSLFKHVKRVAAADFSRELAVKVRAGHLNVVAKGFATGSLPCLGYRRQAFGADGKPKAILESGEHKSRVTDHTKWVLGPKSEQDLVLRIFEQYAQGVSLRQLSSMLAAEGVRCHNGTPISAVKLRRLIENEIVIGVFRWGTRYKTYNKGVRLPPLAEPLRNTGMVDAIVAPELWAKVQARCARDTDYHRRGYSKVEMLERMKAALEKNPALGYAGFAAAGLPQPLTYARHFGSLAKAYKAAGRVQTPRQNKFREETSRAQRLRKRFADDVLKLLLRFGVDAVAQRNNNVIIINGVEVKVCAARPLPSPRSPRWLVAHAKSKREPGRWLLVMRLNEDNKTGQDFFLLPSAIHEHFSGRLNTATVRAFRRYRLADSTQLAITLSALA